MRIGIIAGKYGGKKVLAKQSADVRPTSCRTRETAFNVLVHRFLVERIGLSAGEQLKGLMVADLFAGTGGYGFEALSRGAESVSFVEASPQCCEQICLAGRGVCGDEEYEKRVRVWQSRLPELPIFDGQLDLVFVDPPYKNIDVVERLAHNFMRASVLSASAIVVVEHDFARQLPCDGRYGTLEVCFQKKAQRSMLSFFTFKGKF
ncbi:RsmD family RNA methyltransferase [Candidatus Hydrogenosomobacter endosymbioticus]|uniref:RNA methyltransferase n=1 Tax=Candidatus Hydrogenosomobacter endosymbioticus TaxID=2558174 RepID=A0ABM7V8S9_9PROT|nr:RsmD family RNA methyltransferase [Candidatus Hydrogenosomobacter endosymbioticus]BDB96209.1 RNA methyltransferase [Candidatus Hydrogenosomobacter endosymbioticus]